jgi:Flp pilus assembly protein TadD
VSFAAVLALTSADRVFTQANAVETATESDAVREATELAKNGYLPAAIIALKNAARANPKDGATRKLLADYHLRAGDAASAEKEYRAAIDNGIALGDVVDGLVVSLLMQNQAERLLKEFDAATHQGDTLLETAFQAMPNNREVAYHLAVACKTKGDTTRALGLLDAALAAQINFVERSGAETLQRSLRGN